MAIVRAEVIAKARGAFRKGESASRFIQDMRAKGLGYRRSDMLADWRSVNQLETKKNLLQYVRKDRYPTVKNIAAVTWNMSKEYMYVVKVKSRISPEEPIVERMVNIQRDVPLTPAMIEAQVKMEWVGWEKYKEEEIVEILPFTAARKVME